MLSTLKFVQGAVAKKDYVPTLTHFSIKDGKVLGFNGALAICCPINVNLECSPKARPFVKAIEICNDTVEMRMASNGKLSIRSGSFSVYVDCSPEPFPDVKPEGKKIELKGNILEALQKLSPFIGEDASRPWARGILFRGNSAFATNNIVATEFWLGYQFPIDLNIPEVVVYELIRIGEEPTYIQMDENSVTFHFNENRWLRTQLLATEWPDVSRILDKESCQIKLPDTFYPSLEKILPFLDDQERVYFHKDKVATSVVESSGASVEVPGMIEGPIFNSKQLQKLEGIVKTIDFTLYPDPCIFYGDYLRGAILGMRP